MGCAASQQQQSECAPAQTLVPEQPLHLSHPDEDDRERIRLVEDTDTALDLLKISSNSSFSKLTWMRWNTQNYACPDVVAPCNNYLTPSASPSPTLTPASSSRPHYVKSALAFPYILVGLKETANVTCFLFPAGGNAGIPWFRVRNIGRKMHAVKGDFMVLAATKDEETDRLTLVRTTTISSRSSTNSWIYLDATLTDGKPLYYQLKSTSRNMAVLSDSIVAPRKRSLTGYSSSSCKLTPEQCKRQHHCRQIAPSDDNVLGEWLKGVELLFLSM